MARITGNKVIEGALSRLGTGTSGIPTNSIVVYAGTANSGSPASGTAGYGAGTLGPATLLQSTAATKLYINSNTKASPTWTVVGTQT